MPFLITLHLFRLKTYTYYFNGSRRNPMSLPNRMVQQPTCRNLGVQSTYRNLLEQPTYRNLLLAIPGLFFFIFCRFYKQLTVNKCSIKVADDWIRTWVLWSWRRPAPQPLPSPIGIYWYSLQGFVFYQVNLLHVT